MLRGVWQALNCLFIYATFCVIAKGASPGQTKMKAGLRKMAIFTDAMHAVYAVMRCPSVRFFTDIKHFAKDTMHAVYAVMRCPSVRLVFLLILNISQKIR